MCVIVHICIIYICVCMYIIYVYVYMYITCIHCIYTIYHNYLQATVQLFQHQLAVNRMSKNPVVAQSTRLDVSSYLVFSIHCHPKEGGSNTSEGMDMLARRGQATKEQKPTLSMSFL